MSLIARLTGPWRAVPILGLTQIIGWGSTFYAIAVLKPDIAAETGWSQVMAVAGISISFAAGGLVAPLVGRTIAARGGSRVMAAGSVLTGISVAALYFANNEIVWLGLWCVIGFSQAMNLYDAAFATLAEIFGSRARAAITALTLIAGFSSTVFWPLTYFLNETFGWRETYLIYGALNLFLCAPLHAFALPASRAGYDAAAPERAETQPAAKLLPPNGLPFILLAVAFSISTFFMSAFAVHLVGMLETIGLTAAAAVAAGALVGPSQVAGRLAEFVFARRRHPIEVALFTTLLMPLAFLLLAVGGAEIALAFAVGYGVSQGMLTIVRGTVPLALFGASGFAIVLGRLAAPVLAAQAIAPVAFGYALQLWGPRTTLYVSSALGLCSLAAIGWLALRLKARKP
jgi:predicted MFS family arabinose efflux permease